eukprot:CFRG4397T1
MSLLFNVRASDLTFRLCLMHSLSTETTEVMGLLLGEMVTEPLSNNRMVMQCHHEKFEQMMYQGYSSSFTIVDVTIGWYCIQ